MKTDASSVPFDVALEAVNAGSTSPKHIRRLLLAAGDELAALFEVADVKRRQSVGDAVHLRAIIGVFQPLCTQLQLLRPAGG